MGVRCAEVIESLFQMANAPPINELIDLKGKGHNQKNGGKDKLKNLFLDNINHMTMQSHSISC